MNVLKPCKIVVIAGPTASGKTPVSMNIAEEINAEIISADSLLVYKHMDIGTAKPTIEERKRVTHHLIDIVEPWEEYTSSKYRIDAVAAIEDIKTRGKKFIVVGGTGFYINALINQTFDAPKADPALRAELEARSDLYEELKKVDPASAARIHPNDRYRTVRAMEVFYATKRTMTHFREEHEKNKVKEFEPLIIVLNPSKEEQIKNIEGRTQKMLRDGLVDEVKGLLKMGASPDHKPMQSIGYKQAVDFINGRINKEEMAESIRTETLALAKRQVTWFKKREDTKWYHPLNDIGRIRNDIIGFIS